MYHMLISINFTYNLITGYRKVILVGDSIIKGIPPIEGVTLSAHPGATIANLSVFLTNKHISLEGHDIIIVHVGTNNIGRRDSFAHIVSDFGNLIASIRKAKPDIRIIISSILPRPVDHHVTDPMIKDVNRFLNLEMSRDLGFKFVCSYKAVSKYGTYRRYLFAKLDKGLHLNLEGANRLRHFFLMVISNFR